MQPHYRRVELGASREIVPFVWGFQTRGRGAIGPKNTPYLVLKQIGAAPHAPWLVVLPDWELGRPPRRGAGAEREHFFRYTQRHCMVYPNRSPHEVIERLKLMFRYNGMKVRYVVENSSHDGLERT